MRKKWLGVICIVLLASFVAMAAGQDVNKKLAAWNKNIAKYGIAIQKAEYYVLPNDAVYSGRTIYADDRTKTLDTRWVPHDPRRDAFGDAITFLVYQDFALSDEGIDLNLPVVDSFNSWEGAKCTKLDVVQRPDTGENPSVIFGGDPFLADVTVLGFLPGYLFDWIEPGGSTYILGVTFTYIFINSATGQATDVNHDGYADTALKEIWFNDAFTWKTDPGLAGIDIETVALHEIGHAFELGHFGAIFRTNSNGKLHFAPRAVMNAAYAGVLRSLLGTDKGAFCSVWANWPRMW
jgi:hypothetical protein